MKRRTLEDKDYIKDLFQDKLANHTEKVNPKVWAGVQSQIANVGASASAVGMSLLSKVAIGVISLGTIAVVGYVVLKEDIQQDTTKEIKANKSIDYQQESDLIEDNFEAEFSVNENSINTESPLSTSTSENSSVERDISQTLVSEVTQELNVSTDISSSNSQFTAISGTVLDSNSFVEPISDVNSTANEKNRQADIEQIDAVINAKKIENSYKLSLSNTDFDYVEWDLGSSVFSTEKELTHTFKEGEHFIKARLIKGNETKVLEYRINVEGSTHFGELSNVVTFNDDGVNDIWSIEVSGVEDFLIVVLNTKNEKVFESTDPNFEWDGRDFSGNRVEKGSYFYLITGYDSEGTPINKYETLTVLK